MNILKLAALAALMTLAAAQAQEVEKKVEIKVVVDGNGDDVSEMHWVSDDLDFDLQDLAVGETRTIQGESGKTVTVTRSQDGFEFDVDGKAVSMPHMGDHAGHMAFVETDGVHENVDVRVMGGGAHAMRAHSPEGVTIISGKPLDDSVKESIRSVLISAGNNEEVTFIEGGEGGKRVIVKKVEIVQ